MDVIEDVNKSVCNSDKSLNNKENCYFNLSLDDSYHEVTIWNVVFIQYFILFRNYYQ